MEKRKLAGSGFHKRRSVSLREEMDQLTTMRRDRDLIRKRRRVSESSSDDEEMENNNRINNNIINNNNINQSVPNRSSNRRASLRTLRSSPVFRREADDLFNAPIPKKSRSVSNKRLNDQLNKRRFSSFSPSSSTGGSSMRNKMKSVEPRLRNNSDFVIQDDIEFEVAEVLFDLSKQSQSQSPKNNAVVIDDLNRGKSIVVQNEERVVVVDQIEEINGKEKLSDDGEKGEDELLGRDLVVSRGKEKVNACRFQDQTMTILDSGSVSVGTKEATFDTGSMGPPLKLCVSAGKDLVLYDAASNSKVMTGLDVMERRASILRQQEQTEAARSSQLANLDLEKHAHDVSATDGNQQPWGVTEQRSQSSNSFLSFPTPMNGWHDALPHPGYTSPLQALPMNGNVRSTSTTQTHIFKFAQPRSKRSATHGVIALSIQSHKQLGNTSLLSGVTGAHNGGLNNKSSEVANAMRTSSPTLAPQQAMDQFPAAKFFGHAMSFNQPNMATLHQNGSQFPIPPNIGLQKNRIQVPALPFFNSSFYSTPVFDASQNQQQASSRKPPRGQKQTGPSDIKSAPDTMKNSLIPGNSQLFSVPIQPMNGVTKNRDSQQKGYQPFPLSFGSSPSTNASLNFQMLPDMPRDGYQKFFQASESNSAVGSANLENGLKGIFEKTPENSSAQTRNFTKSGCSADVSASMFDGLARTMNLVASSSPGSSVTIPNFNQHNQQLIQLQKHHMQLNGVKDPIFSSMQWDTLPQQIKNSQGQAQISFGNMPFASASFQGRNVESHYTSSLPKNVAGNLRSGPPSSALPSNPVDVSQSGPGQKSSPACRRNVPSILGTCTSQPSELKY